MRPDSGQLLLTQPAQNNAQSVFAGARQRLQGSEIQRVINTPPRFRSQNQNGVEDIVMNDRDENLRLKKPNIGLDFLLRLPREHFRCAVGNEDLLGPGQ